MVKPYGKGKFKSDAQRRAVFSNINYSKKNDYRSRRYKPLWFDSSTGLYDKKTKKRVDEKLPPKIRNAGIYDRNKDWEEYREIKRNNPNNPKKKWYKKAVMEKPPYKLNWKKTQSAKVRRRHALESRPKSWSLDKRYLSAGRALRALANVTKDKATKRKAIADANYFFKKARET